MDRTNVKMHFEIFESNANSPLNLNDTGVIGGILFTKKNLEENIPPLFWHPLDYYSINEYHKYELWIWLGHEGYIYQRSAIKVDFSDIDYFAHLFEDQEQVKKKVYPRMTRGSHGHRYCYRRSSKVNNLGRNVYMVEDWANVFPQLKGKNRREKLFLKDVATDWDAQVTARGNGWKDNSKLRHQWEKGL